MVSGAYQLASPTVIRLATDFPPPNMVSMGNMPLPIRGNLVEECARVIRLRLEEGEWSGRLPGERTLAQTLEVGRDTVRQALQCLEYEKVLGPAQAGSKRLVLIAPKHPVTSRTETLRIGVLSSRRLEQLPQPNLFEIDLVRCALADKGGDLDLFAPSWFEQEDPTRQLARLVEEKPCSAWILLRANAQIQRWFAESSIPCLVRGYPHHEGLLPHLDVDWEVTARHAAGRLWRHGHRRAGILIPPQHLQGVEAAVRGAGTLGEADFSMIEIPEDGTVDGMGRTLARVLKLNSPPTAIIAPRPRQAITALTWLGSQGIRVPLDFSIVSLGHEPFMNNLVPELSGYRIDPEAVSKLVIRRIKQLVSGISGRGGISWITPEVVKGASIRTLG